MYFWRWQKESVLLHICCRERRIMLGIIFEYIELLFGIEMLILFVAAGLFLLIWDVPILKKKMLRKESTILKVLGYIYIFGSIILFIIVKNT